MSRWAWAALAAAAAVGPLVWLLAAGFGHDPHALPSVLEGHPAPAFDLADLDGQSWQLARLRGRPAVINFWSTWCLPCRAEHGLLQAAARRFAGQVQFLGIVYQDEPDAIRQLLTRHPSAYPHLLDPEAHAAIDYGVAGVPETFFLDAAGAVVHKQAGVLDEATLLGQLLPLLPAAGPP